MGMIGNQPAAGLIGGGSIQDGSIQTIDIADGAITAAKLAAGVLTPASVSDQSNSSTGGFDLPAGTTAQRPSSPSTGMTRFNSDLASR